MLLIIVIMAWLWWHKRLSLNIDVWGGFWVLRTSSRIAWKSKRDGLEWDKETVAIELYISERVVFMGEEAEGDLCKKGSKQMTTAFGGCGEEVAS